MLLLRREAGRDIAFNAKLNSENKKFFINSASIGNSLVFTLRIERK